MERHVLKGGGAGERKELIIWSIQVHTIFFSSKIVGCGRGKKKKNHPRKSKEIFIRRWFSHLLVVIIYPHVQTLFLDIIHTLDRSHPNSISMLSPVLLVFPPAMQ